MATLCTSVDAEDILPRQPLEQPLSQVFGRKRSRGPKLPASEAYENVASVDSEPRRFEDNHASQLVWEPSQGKAVPRVMERHILHDVSAIRTAAAAAVAEFTGPFAPSLQLTDPDTFHEERRSEASANSAVSTGRKESYCCSEVYFTAQVPVNESLIQNDKNPEVQKLQTPHKNRSSQESVFSQQGCPPHGAKAICGRRPRMEDAYTAVPFLLEVLVPVGIVAEAEIFPPRIAPVKSRASSQSSIEAEAVNASEQANSKQERVESNNKTCSSQEPAASYLETLHFFGVFDGHGGAEAALHCAQTLHQRIAEALASATDPADAAGKDQQLVEESGLGSGERGTEDSLEPADFVSLPSGLPSVLENSSPEQNPGQAKPQAVDSAMDEPIEGSEAIDSASFESALAAAFQLTDEEFGKADNAALVGTTAVVSLVGSRQLYVANCGDSRAVLCRAGIAIPLTDDHKAAREDETARVEAAGGQILFWNGVRVMGVLAVSRAIGDHCLRPYVIAQPEVTILARRPDDELLLLASDGLWDVLSNQEACTLANRCLRRARQRGASRQSAARIAATVLTRAAIDRGSRDNVTVLVVDLSNGGVQENATRTLSTVLAEDAADDTHERDPDERLARMQSQLLSVDHRQ